MHGWHVAYKGGTAQAVGELRSVDGRLAAKSSRPVLPKPRPAVVALARSIATLPLAAVGLWHEYSKMQASLPLLFPDCFPTIARCNATRFRGLISKMSAQRQWGCCSPHPVTAWSSCR